MGETARTTFCRGEEHLAAIDKMDPESPLVEHTLSQHPGDPCKFRMEVMEFCRGNLLRQATEGVRISQMADDKTVAVLNRRGNGGRICHQSSHWTQTNNLAQARGIAEDIWQPPEPQILKQIRRIKGPGSRQVYLGCN